MLMNEQISILEQQMLTLIGCVFDAYTVTLFLPETPEADQSDDMNYKLAAYYSLGDAVLPETRIRAGLGPVGWIVRKRAPLEVPKYDQQQGRLFYYAQGEEETIKAFLGCPMPSGGALCVDTKRQYSFTDREARLLQMFAAILDTVHSMGTVDEHLGDIPVYFAQLAVFDTLRSNYKRWGDFIKGILHGIADATGFDYCAFASEEVPGESYSITAENQPVLVREGKPFYQSMGSGLAGWVFRNGQPVFQTGEDGRAPALFGTSQDLPDFAAVICLPIFINKSTRACLCLGHTEPKTVDETMRTFLREAVGVLSMHSEILFLRNRLRSFMAQAKVYRSGPRAHNPDTDPYQPVMRTEE